MAVRAGLGTAESIITLHNRQCGYSVDMWGPGKCFLCFTDTETQCDKCGLYYCDDHLSSHRLQCVTRVVTRELHVCVSRYQDTCLPFAVETRPGVGRVVTATRDIKVGNNSM